MGAADRIMLAMRLSRTQGVRMNVVRHVHSSTSATSTASRPAAATARGSWRPLRGAVLLGLFGAGSYVLGTLYPPETLQLLFPPPAPVIPAVGSAEADAYVDKLEREMLNLPHVRALLTSVSAAQPFSSSSTSPSASSTTNPATKVDALDASTTKAHYILSRPFRDFPHDMRSTNLTAGSLRQPGLLAVSPIVLSKTQHGARALGGAQGDAFTFLHLGHNLCGHKGIVHGGLLATVLDETLARSAFFHLPNHVGVTARLEIDYKCPVRANNVVVVETRVLEHVGRKAWVQATMRDLRGQTLVESKALFVEPKLAKWLDLSAVSKVMDRREEE